MIFNGIMIIILLWLIPEVFVFLIFERDCRSVFEAIFGKTLTPAEQAKEWTSKLRGEIRTIEREIRSTQPLCQFEHWV
jgi:hypothetical protein